MSRYLIIAGFLFAALAICPFLILEDDHWFAAHINDLHFILVEISLSLLAIGLYIHLKKSWLIIPMAIFGMASVLDSLNYLFDKNVNSRPWALAIIIISILCSLLLYFWQTKPNSKL